MKHLIKISSYPENEAIIYCPNKNKFGFIRLDSPIRCPHCDQLIEVGRKGKIVLNYETPLD